MSPSDIDYELIKRAAQRANGIVSGRDVEVVIVLHPSRVTDALLALLEGLDGRFQVEGVSVIEDPRVPHPDTLRWMVHGDDRRLCDEVLSLLLGES